MRGKRKEGREVGVWPVESNDMTDSSVSVISKYDIEMPVRTPGAPAVSNSIVLR